MTTPAGEDRLLGLKVVEEWVAKADAEMGHTEHWVDDELPELEPEDLTQVRDELRRSLGREKARSMWLARLCARVRHLEAERDELLKARSIWDTSIVAAWKAEQETRAASQRLTEANASLRGAIRLVLDQAKPIIFTPSEPNPKPLMLVKAVPTAALEAARALLGAGAPPEDAR